MWAAKQFDTEKLCTRDQFIKLLGAFCRPCSWLPRDVAHMYLTCALLLVEQTTKADNLGVAKDDESAESDDG
eukprot:COSAG01_NODE_59820_length_298_cov_0.698492_1_plen_71_part_01